MEKINLKELKIEDILENDKKFLKAVGKAVYTTVLFAASLKLLTGCAYEPQNTGIRYIGTDNEGHSKVYVHTDFMASTLTFNSFGEYLGSTRPVVQSQDFIEFMKRHNPKMSDIDNTADFPIGAYFGKMMVTAEKFQKDSLKLK